MNHVVSPDRNAAPGRWLRLFYRAPVALYRHGGGGFERAIGWRWIMLVTRGRRSGREHAVMLDLLGHEGDRYYVQAAYGRRADWLRNIEASGEFEAQVGRRRFTARLEHIADDEARRIMLSYVEAHPIYSPFIARMLGYPGPLRAFATVADWLVDTFGMLAILDQS